MRDGSAVTHACDCSGVVSTLLWSPITCARCGSIVFPHFPITRLGHMCCTDSEYHGPASPLHTRRYHMHATRGLEIRRPPNRLRPFRRRTTPVMTRASEMALYYACKFSVKVASVVIVIAITSTLSQGTRPSGLDVCRALLRLLCVGNLSTLRSGRWTGFYLHVQAYKSLTACILHPRGYGYTSSLPASSELPPK